MQSKSSQYLNGFDWLRAVMSVLVVTWHLHTFGPDTPLYSEQFALDKLQFWDFVNFNVIVPTVPTFFMISCFFLARKGPSWVDFRRQLGRIGKLVLFWLIILTIWKGGFSQLKRLVPSSPMDLFVKFFSVNGEYYYFFIALSISLIIAFLFYRLSTPWVVGGLVVTGALVFYLPHMVIDTGRILWTEYWNPINFLPYPLAAILIYRYHERLLADWRRLALVALALLAGAALLAWYEWTHFVNEVFLFQGFAFVLLMRMSLVIEASAAVLVAAWPWPAAPAMIRFMSKHSLALYVLHPIFKPFVAANLSLGFLPDAAARLINLVVVVLLCYATSLVAIYFLKEDLLR